MSATTTPAGNCHRHKALRARVRASEDASPRFQNVRLSAILERAGVSRSFAMTMTGHTTGAVYRRYALMSEQDLHEPALKLVRVEQQGRVLGKAAAVREQSCRATVR